MSACSLGQLVEHARQVEDGPVSQQLLLSLTELIEGGINRASTTLSIESAAANLGVSVRTLQRMLRRRGTSFSALIDARRFELAVSRMRDLDRSLIQVACELGYSDPSHFTRAFRRWTGEAPSVYRTRLANELTFWAPPG